MLRVESVFAPRAVVGVGKGRGTVEVTLDAALRGVVVDVVSVTSGTTLCHSRNSRQTIRFPRHDRRTPNLSQPSFDPRP